MEVNDAQAKVIFQEAKRISAMNCTPAEIASGIETTIKKLDLQQRDADIVVDLRRFKSIRSKWMKGYGEGTTGEEIRAMEWISMKVYDFYRVIAK